MSKTAIVKSGEQFFIKQLSKSQPIKLDKVIFANISGINGDTEIDLNGSMPDSSQIVHTAPVTQSGLLNDKTVVYSIILDTNVGDFSFNYIGLVNEETDTLCMVMHTDLTRKIKTAGQRQGNTITESIWLEIDNASESTGITVNAQTWQIDYSKRLAGEDERIRLTNYDLYNRIAINDGLDITKPNNQLIVSPGIVYIAGLRVELLEVININVENNQSLYVDAWLVGTITGEWTVKFNLITGANLYDYHDGNFQHYVERIASVDNAGNLIKVNPRSFVTTFDLASLTKTGIVKLSSAIGSTSETEAATPKAVHDAYEYARFSDQKAQAAYDHASAAHNRIDPVVDRFKSLEFESHVCSGDKKQIFVVRNDGIAGVYDTDKNDFSWFINRGGWIGGFIDSWRVGGLDQFVRDRTPPVGVPLPWPQVYPPAGYFECNGSSFNINNHPQLAAAYPSGFLPDLRGEFIRGWDNGRLIDAGRGLLSWQNCAVQSHNHSINSLTSFSVSGNICASVARGSQQTAWTNHFGDNETRPRNVAFMYIVKAE